MTSLVNKICTNIRTSTGYYLLNWVLASMCSFSRKSWILFTVSTCRVVAHSFQNLIWTAMTLLFTVTSFFGCVHGRYDSFWCYLSWTVVLIFTMKIFFVQNHKVNLINLSNLKEYLNLGVWNLKFSFVPLGSKHLSYNICPEP